MSEVTKGPTGCGMGFNLWVIGRSHQLSLNKFFDPSTPSMRKGRDGGEEKKVKTKKKKERK